MCSLLLVVGAMMSCSGDDNKIDDESGNTSDVAVTGLPSEIGSTYVCLNGYVNLNLLPAGGSSPSIGIELYVDKEQTESESDKDYYWDYETTQDIVGNKLTISFDGLAGKETYKYRTFVKSGSLSYYGEYRTFTTKDFVNITSTGDASDITFTSASISATANVESVNSKEDIGIGIAYSTSKSMLHPDSLFNKKEGYLDSLEDKSYKVSLSRLLAGTEYYYCSYTRAGSSYKLGTIKSFKTKSLDNQLQTSEATDVTFFSAVLNGTSMFTSLYPEGSYIFYGFRYALTKEALEGVNIPEGYYYYDSYYDYEIFYNTQTGDKIEVYQGDVKTVSAPVVDNTFKVQVTNLRADKTYYYCAYARVDGVELTGEVKSFTTKSLDSIADTRCRTALLETYSGQACVNCPDSHKEATALHEEYHDNLIIVTIHAGAYGISAPAGLKQTEGDEYADKFGVKTYPIGMVNRRDGLKDYPSWGAAVYAEIQRETQLNISVEASVSNGKLNVNTDLLALEALEGKLQLWVIEDSIIAPQVSHSGVQPQYVHNHVFRDAINGTWGEYVSLTLGEKKTMRHNEFELNTAWNLENLSVVAFVYNNDGVLQASKCKVKTN